MMGPESMEHSEQKDSWRRQSSRCFKNRLVSQLWATLAVKSWGWWSTDSSVYLRNRHIWGKARFFRSLGFRTKLRCEWNGDFTQIVTVFPDHVSYQEIHIVIVPVFILNKKMHQLFILWLVHFNILPINKGFQILIKLVKSDIH